MSRTGTFISHIKTELTQPYRKLNKDVIISFIFDASNLTHRFMMFLIIVIALVLIFDFINDIHGSADPVAAIISTKVLFPHAAVTKAAFPYFTTMGKGAAVSDRLI